jgi:hypothetical protein
MRQPIVICLALFLAGCSTLGVDRTERTRALDPLHDDISDLLVAFDLPRGIGPIEGASTLSVDVTAPGGEPRRVKASLAPADADEIAGHLPPPGTGRAYYLFGVADNDKAAIRDAQLVARTPGAAGSKVNLVLAPRLCKSGEVDPKLVTISVLAALPGDTALAPLIDRQLLADTLAAAGGDLPACR